MRMAVASASTSYSLSMDAEIPLEANPTSNTCRFFRGDEQTSQGYAAQVLVLPVANRTPINYNPP
jgi:hypothetical protein